METLLPIIQIILSATLVGLILMQQSDSSLGAAFGGGDSGGMHTTRRGFDLFIYRLTIVVAVLFGISTLVAIMG